MWPFHGVVCQLCVQSHRLGKPLDNPLSPQRRLRLVEQTSLRELPRAEGEGETKNVGHLTSSTGKCRTWFPAPTPAERCTTRKRYSWITVCFQSAAGVMQHVFRVGTVHPVQRASLSCSWVSDSAQNWYMWLCVPCHPLGPQPTDGNIQTCEDEELMVPQGRVRPRRAEVRIGKLSF